MKKSGLDGYLINDLIDLRYITGFFFAMPGEAAVLVTQKDFYCFTRELYVADIKKKFPSYKVSAPRDFTASNVEKIKELGLKAAAFDPNSTSYKNGKMLEACAAPFPSIVQQIREFKDEEEIKNTRKACQIAYQAYEHAKKNIKTGVTERQIATLIEQFMQNKGATGTSFSTIVAFGPNSANPHYHTGNAKLKKEDAILMDFGCVYNGYCSDITRAWWHGKKEPKEYTKIWNVVNDAWQKTLKAKCYGWTGKEIDLIGRSIIQDAGYIENFNHGIGHGVGMEIHEEPYVNPVRGVKPILENAVVTVEPGIYLSGKYGVRLEETCVMGKKGLQILTRK